MRTVNIHAAKTHLSRLVDEVAAGEEIVIAKAGKPLARLVPYTSGREPPDPRPHEGQALDRRGFRRAVARGDHGGFRGGRP